MIFCFILQQGILASSEHPVPRALQTHGRSGRPGAAWPSRTSQHAASGPRADLPKFSLRLHVQLCTLRINKHTVATTLELAPCDGGCGRLVGACGSTHRERGLCRRVAWPLAHSGSLPLFPSRNPTTGSRALLKPKPSVSVLVGRPATQSEREIHFFFERPIGVCG